MSFPLLVRSARTAFEEVDPRLVGIARTLGHGPFAAFFRVTLPLAWRGVLAGTVLAFSRALGEFGATVMIAGNIPGKTQTLALAIFHDNQIGRDDRALVLAGVTVALAFTALWLTEWITRTRGRTARGVIEARVELPLARFPLRVELKLGAGVTALMGPSGSGKTSLLEVHRRPAARGPRPDRRSTASAWLDSGRRTRPAAAPARVGYVPQDAGLFPHSDRPAATSASAFGRRCRRAETRDRHARDPRPARPLPGLALRRREAARGARARARHAAPPPAAGRAAGVARRWRCADASCRTSSRIRDRVEGALPLRHAQRRRGAGHRRAAGAPAGRRGARPRARPAELLSVPGVLPRGRGRPREPARRRGSSPTTRPRRRDHAPSWPPASPSRVPLASDRAPGSARHPADPRGGRPRLHGARFAGSRRATSIRPASRRWSGRCGAVTLRCAVGDVPQRHLARACHPRRRSRRSGSRPGPPVWLAVKSHSIRFV